MKRMHSRVWLGVLCVFGAGGFDWQPAQAASAAATGVFANVSIQQP